MSERGYAGNVINKNESLAITDPLKSHHSEAFCTARVEDFDGAWFLVNRVMLSVPVFDCGVVLRQNHKYQRRDRYDRGPYRLHEGICEVLKYQGCFSNALGI
jgi:hypothetical protein